MSREYWDDRYHEYLLAFSRKRRHFCPSCHQKRVVEFGEWLYANVLKSDNFSLKNKLNVVSIRSVYRLLGDGNLRGTKIRGCLRISVEEIGRYESELADRMLKES